jgi:hypothetical protein
MSFGKTNRLGKLSTSAKSPKALPASGFAVLALASIGACLLVQPAPAQYVGKVGKNAKDTPELRSVAVLEWTGEPGKPKFSRLVPVSVLDGGQLQDGGIYLARPQPLAVVPEVEYELQQDGKPLGLFDIKEAGQQFGSWIGLGAWKPMPAAHPKLTAKQLAKVDVDDDAGSDEPVLHRKHNADDSPATSTGGGSSTPAAPSDPDRPVLHKAPSADSSNTTANGPVLHKHDDSANSTAATTDDPDRPVLHKPRQPAAAETADADQGSGSSDPDRPRLMRGKSTGGNIPVAPTLLGLPPDLEQTVAVSDAQSHPAHPWDYSWTNPEDEAKMKASLEQMARTALGIEPSAPKPAPRRASATSTTSKAKPAAPAPPPVPLADEKFRVFELAYGAGATMVFSAHTDGPADQQKFVTLIAQPDLYGNVLVLKKNVTDAAHLDQTPRMRLIDAVDALADNRGELLFELRGATERQFALYRVLRGQAEQLFVTGGGQFADASVQ